MCIRDRRPTAEYLGYVMNRLLFVGAAYLGVIAILPNLLLDLGIGGSRGGGAGGGMTASVSYTHLTLPTIYSV